MIAFVKQQTTQYKHWRDRRANVDATNADLYLTISSESLKVLSKMNKSKQKIITIEITSQT